MEYGLAAEQVAELTDDRGGDRRRQQIAGDHPRLVAGTTEIRDHRRQRGGDDRLVQRGQEHAEQHRDKDEVAALRTDQGTAAFGIRGSDLLCRCCHTCLSSGDRSP
jgi:hypothetical protein